MTVHGGDIREVFSFCIFNRGLVLDEKHLIYFIGDVLCFPAIPSNLECVCPQPWVCVSILSVGEDLSSHRFLRGLRGIHNKNCCI